jgi:hypothetical protein
MSCHHAAPLLGIRSACGHAHDAASSGTTAFRGVLPAVVDEHPQLVDGMNLPPVALFDARPLAEPPTDPPRSFVV